MPVCSYLEMVDSFKFTSQNSKLGSCAAWLVRFGLSRPCKSVGGRSIVESDDYDCV